MTELTYKERTAHIRRALKAYGPKCKVSQYKSCGMMWVRISAPTYEGRFTPDELEQIALVAKGNKLTNAAGSPIDIEIMRQMTGCEQFHFVYWE